MGNKRLTKSDCIMLLREKNEILKKTGGKRYPKRSDFTDREVTAIKAYLGPWPRALEAAGVKPPRQKQLIKKRGN